MGDRFFLRRGGQQALVGVRCRAACYAFLSAPLRHGRVPADRFSADRWAAPCFPQDCRWRSQMRLIQLESVSQLRRAAEAWDRLWQRSDVTLPTARAELVAQWVEFFADRGAVWFLAVEQDGDLAAALPLVARRVGGVVSAADVARNWWSPSGELLLDPEADWAVVNRLAEGVVHLPRPLAWLEVVPYRTPSWQKLLGAVAQSGASLDIHVRGRCATLSLADDFHAYLATRDGRHRYNLRRNRRRLEQLGTLRTRVITELAASEVERELARAFDIEHRSWKGRRGQSVLATPGMFGFFCRQAETLAGQGSFRLAFLEVAGQPVAFEMGSCGKGVYHSAKIGYDPVYRRYGPGQLLREELIRWLHQQPGHVGADFHAQPVGAAGRWANGSYPLARVVVASGRLWGAACLAAYRTLGPLLRRLRDARQSRRRH
ncbi:MAG TPA: GNAT family N-acetyltransferase [Planctomycetes bacterium]|nr:GNAT family N-acetyltransferase [Planctomycetota bacterium]